MRVLAVTYHSSSSLVLLSVLLFHCSSSSIRVSFFEPYLYFVAAAIAFFYFVVLHLYIYVCVCVCLCLCVL